MSTHTPSRRIQNGLVGIIILTLAVGVGQSFSSVPMLFATPTYYAQFANSGGLRQGDKVRVAGVDVGQVRSIEIQGDTVLIGYSLKGVTFGTDSRANIRTETLLGRKNIQIEPKGQTALRPNGILPVKQTTTPYQLYDVFRDATKATSGWDTESIRRSLSVLSETIGQTAPHLSAALEAVARFSTTIGKRDDDIKTLLANANKIATVLGNRGDQINQLLVNSQTLLAAFVERRGEINLLLQQVSAFARHVQGFIDDNPNLNHVLEQLKTISNVLVARKADLANVLTALSKFTTSLGEAVGSGPFFKVMIANLIPYQILQPFVDAAFKKRGLDPEEFWRSAGLPAFRFPDPNGQRVANGAPPPAPPALEGTPDHPRPAVPPGSPCSYSPPPTSMPSAGNPLPCSAATAGPFGGLPDGLTYQPPPDVAITPSNLAAPPPGPGVPSAAIPGQLPPDVPGLAPPQLSSGLPGARTVPVGPRAPG